MQGELIVRNASIAFREPNGTSYRCRVTLLTGIRYPDPGLISSYRLYKTLCNIVANAIIVSPDQTHIRRHDLLQIKPPTAG